MTTHNGHKRKQSCPRVDSNPRSQPVSSRRPTQTARPLGSVLFTVCLGVSVLGSGVWCYICVFMCVHEYKFVQVTTNSHIWNSSRLLKQSSIDSASYHPQVDCSKMSYLKQHFRTLISWKDDCKVSKAQSSPAYCKFRMLYVIEEQKWFVIDQLKDKAIPSSILQQAVTLLPTV